MISTLKINLTVFTSGFVLMVFEIVGSRVLAPFLGSSSVVWTSIIGVILAFMSAGYWYGGKMADKYPTAKRLAFVLVLAAIAILVMNLSKNFVLIAVTSLPINLMTKSVVCSMVLFSIPSFLMAFVTPFAIRISSSDVKNSGETAGSIYAVSTIGSIAGTFFSGFVFIALFGTNQILWSLAIVLFAIAALLSIATVKANAVWGLILILGNIYYSAKGHDYVDIDTDYSRIIITEQKHNDRDARMMSISGYVNSGMYLDHPNELVYAYTEFYDLLDVYLSDWKSAVMFGGAGYSYPKHFQNTFPDKQLDVVEIDPKITEIAEKYFSFIPDSTTHIYHQDARFFLAHSTQKYDAVLYDVLTSNLTVPFHLTTREAFEGVSNIMTGDGVLILNVIGDLNGIGSIYVKSEIKTLKEVFPQVHVFNAMGKDYVGITNNIIVALKTSKEKNELAHFSEYEHLLSSKIDVSNLEGGFVFTDNFAPANHLISK